VGGPDEHQKKQGLLKEVESQGKEAAARKREEKSTMFFLFLSGIQNIRPPAQNATQWLRLEK